MRRLPLALAVLIGLAAVGTAFSQAVAIGLPVSQADFGTLDNAPLLSQGAAYPGPPTPHSLQNVKIVPALRKALRQPGVAQALAARGFVVVPSDFRLFHYAYDGNVYDGWPVFVTTDVAYHEWHLAFDKILRSTEQQVLLPKLKALVTGLLVGAHAQTKELAGTRLASSASKVEQLYQVAAAELGLPAALGPLALKEKLLVDAHSANEISPLTGTPIDYSNFTPRGHYTRTKQLTQYFEGMSVLGQLAFCLPGTVDCPGLEPARQAILASRVLTAKRALVALWRAIYEPTAFLVGVADDYTPLEVAKVAGGLGDARPYGSDARVKALLQKLVASRPVQITPQRASIRVMGTRFVIDSFLLDQLVYPHVGTAAKPRLLPSALDVAAAFGSHYAYEVLKQLGVTSFHEYDDQLGSLKTAIAKRPHQAWGSTVYDAWLWAAQPMFVADGKSFPDFMRTRAWTAKTLQTGLGTYAELKHDTILYSKQSVAEGGDNVKIPKRRNWVEPEPVAFERLAAAVDLIRRGLKTRNLLTPAGGALLLEELGLFRFFARVAHDELAGKPISRKDNDELTFVGGTFEGIWSQTADRTSDFAFVNDKDSAVVADIASGPKGVVEVGTGRVDRIYVLVPDDQGHFQVAAGGVYSYYELTTPPGQRLTDGLWRAGLAKQKRPAWESVFLAR